MAYNFAYTAVVERHGSIIGLCEEGVKGYRPQPEHGIFPNHEDAQALATKLNQERFTLTDIEAIKITLSTMNFKSSEI